MKYGYAGVQTNGVKEFWEKVDIKGEDDCWDWQWGCFQNGYGNFKTGYQPWKAHRFALTISVGPSPIDKPLAIHSCHNRKCCNPAHLRWGTHKENMAERAARKLPPHNLGKIWLKDTWI